MQPGRGAREVQLVGYRDEVPQMPEFHLGKARRRREEWQPEMPAVSRCTSYKGCRKVSPRNSRSP